MTAAAGPDLAPALDGVRLILHVLAATIWVGGQFTVTGLLPTVRRLGDDAPKQVARALARLLWPAYAVLVVTGFWNMAAVHANNGGSAYQVVLGIKIGVVALAGLGVWLHQRATSRRGLAIWGSVGGTASIAALCLGVFLAG